MFNPEFPLSSVIINLFNYIIFNYIAFSFDFSDLYILVYLSLVLNAVCLITLLALLVILVSRRRRDFTTDDRVRQFLYRQISEASRNSTSTSDLYAVLPATKTPYESLAGEIHDVSYDHMQPPAARRRSAHATNGPVSASVSTVLGNITENAAYCRVDDIHRSINQSGSPVDNMDNYPEPPSNGAPNTNTAGTLWREIGSGHYGAQLPQEHDSVTPASSASTSPIPQRHSYLEVTDKDSSIDESASAEDCRTRI